MQYISSLPTLYSQLLASGLAVCKTPPKEMAWAAFSCSQKEGMLRANPAEVGLAGCQRLVKASNWRVVRRFMQHVRRCSRLFGNLAHHRNEIIQRLSGFGLCWLNH